ncbi:hypothetical protein GCM10025881_04580 [Pseudolysinimonas kribbensis]|uniref:Uncharacterized protein n=1 Tax=Pseudolysinimonas kribbensis TaxID=433641 RepID=A0ABQ6K2S0_9MICO|nr:hypothetical protein [Pseudolysinimonas kribbensis]GMA93634.1 hypothetical protein GCM10025881_04580 [Pseudolysinimonas kribbensis]
MPPVPGSAAAVDVPDGAGVGVPPPGPGVPVGATLGAIGAAVGPAGGALPMRPGAFVRPVASPSVIDGEADDEPVRAGERGSGGAAAG